MQEITQGNDAHAVTPATSPQKRPRGRPRSKQAEKAILEATHHLLATEGLRHTTIEAISAQSGVSRTTIYKWWPNRAALIMSAFLQLSLSRIPYPKTLRSREEIRTVLMNMAREFCGPVGVLMTAIISEAKADPEFAKVFQRDFVDVRRKEGAAAVRAAIAAGVLRPTDPDALLDILLGPLYHRLLIGHQPVSEDYVKHYLDLVFDGIFTERAR